MPYQTDLKEALHDWLGGPTYVREVNGWQWRGSSYFNPGGSVNHHTAGYLYNWIPSLRVLTEGRSGLPGPLCNVGQSRSSRYRPNDRYDIVYLVAAGRANHAGRGGWNGLRGNSSVLGLEIEHVGDLSREPFGERRQETAYRVHCAFMEVGGFGPQNVCQHEEWAPHRKIDFVDADFDGFRWATGLHWLSYHSDIPALDLGEDMIAEAIKTLYNLARRSKDTPYDVSIEDPGGYIHWLGQTAKATDPILTVNNGLIPGLEDEMKRAGRGDRLPLPRL